MKKILPIVIITLIIAGVGGFYGGIKYNQSKSPSLFQKQREQFFQGNVGENFPDGLGNKKAGFSFLNGEVIDKDEQSLTIKMPDGGSRIVFFSDFTEISKIANGLIDDIEIGKQVMVNGEENPDGSCTAETIQIK